MLPRRARAGLAVPVAPLLVPLLGLLLVLAGCGSSSDEDDGSAAPSKATAACREKWKDLAGEVKDRDRATTPSTLPQRWTTVAATIDYYATSAKKGDCASTLASQVKAIAALTAFSARVAPYDMERRLEKVRSAAQTYATSTPAPAPKAKKKSKKQPPKPAAVKAALASLTKQAPIATKEQGPAWQQASVIELTSRPAVAKALKDLKFLSSESAGYRSSTAALAQINQALASAG
jgi:hypothetical protein